MGNTAVQQCLLHVYHFWIHTRSHVLPNCFDERQFFSMTLASTASEKWSEVCFASNEGANNLEATLKAFIMKEVTPNSNHRHKLCNYTAHVAKKRNFPFLELSRFITYYETLNTLIGWLPGARVLDEEGNYHKTPVMLTDKEVKAALYFGMSHMRLRKFAELHFRVDEHTLADVKVAMLENEDILNIGRAQPNWMDQRIAAEMATLERTAYIAPLRVPVHRPQALPHRAMTTHQRHARFRRDVTQGHYSNGRRGQPSYHGRNNSQGRQFVRRGNDFVRRDYNNGCQGSTFQRNGSRNNQRSGQSTYRPTNQTRMSTGQGQGGIPGVMNVAYVPTMPYTPLPPGMPPPVQAMLNTTQRSGSTTRRGNRSGPKGNRPKKGRVNNIFVNMAEVGDLDDNREDDFAEPMEGNQTNVFVADHYIDQIKHLQRRRLLNDDGSVQIGYGLDDDEPMVRQDAAVGASEDNGSKSVPMQQDDSEFDSDSEEDEAQDT
jgi:hypothetical protein